MSEGNQSNTILHAYGWNGYQPIEKLDALGRILTVYGDSCKLITLDGEKKGVFSSSLYATGAVPVTGDWVKMRASDDFYYVEEILPRYSQLERKSPGRRTLPQVLASNIDTLLVVMGMDSDFSPRRIERYLFLAKRNNINTIIVLNKSDIAENGDEMKLLIEQTAPDVPVLVVSSKTGSNMDHISRNLLPGKTYSLIGSSGAGKSTLLNFLAHETLQKTNSLRESDETGKHTTTSRDLFLLPNGSILMDNPGIREVGLLTSDNDVGELFPEIDLIALDCKYKDCSHTVEPGCSVIKAMEEGEITRERFDAYNKLKRELTLTKKSKGSYESLKKKKHEKKMTRALNKRLQEKDNF